MPQLNQRQQKVEICVKISGVCTRAAGGGEEMSCHATYIMYGVWDIFIVHQQLRFTQPLDFDNRVISNFLVASSTKKSRNLLNIYFVCRKLIDVIEVSGQNNSFGLVLTK